jgi:hypothetical protein
MPHLYHKDKWIEIPYEVAGLVLVSGGVKLVD